MEMRSLHKAECTVRSGLGTRDVMKFVVKIFTLNPNTISVCVCVCVCAHTSEVIELICRLSIYLSPVWFNVSTGELPPFCVLCVCV